MDAAAGRRRRSAAPRARLALPCLAVPCRAVPHRAAPRALTCAAPRLPARHRPRCPARSQAAARSQATGDHSACARGPAPTCRQRGRRLARPGPRAPRRRGTARPDMGEGEAGSPPAAERKGAEEEEEDFGYRLFPDRNKKPQSFLVRSLFTFHNKCQLMLRLTLETSKRSPALPRPGRGARRRRGGTRAARGRDLVTRVPGRALPSCRSTPAAAGLRPSPGATALGIR